MRADGDARAPAVVVSGRGGRGSGVIRVHLVIGGFIHRAAPRWQQRRGEQEQQTENAREHKKKEIRAGRDATHILMKRLMPRMNAAIEKATSRPKLPRMAYSQIVEIMLKNDGMRMSIL